MFYRFYNRRLKRNLDRQRAAMIYSQAFRDERFSPAVALFGAAGLIKTTAGIPIPEGKPPFSKCLRDVIKTLFFHYTVF